MGGLMTRDLGKIERQELREIHLYWIDCEYVTYLLNEMLITEIKVRQKEESLS